MGRPDAMARVSAGAAGEQAAVRPAPRATVAPAVAEVTAAAEEVPAVAEVTAAAVPVTAAPEVLAGPRRPARGVTGDGLATTASLQNNARGHRARVASGGTVTAAHGRSNGLRTAGKAKMAAVSTGSDCLEALKATGGATPRGDLDATLRG